MPGLGMNMAVALLVVWGCGSAIFAARDIAASVQARRIRREYTYVEDTRLEQLASQLGCRAEIKVSPQVKEPYSSGVFKLVIYFPYIKFEEEDLRLILRHEMQHIRSHDGLKKLLVIFIKWLFWFNPLAHISMGEIDAALELQCDEKIVRGLDDEESCRYAGTMLAVMRKLGQKEETPGLCAVCLKGNESAMKQRFELLLTNERHRPRTTAALYAAAVLVFAMSYFVIIQPASLPPRVEGEVAIDAENSYIVQENGAYFIYFDGERCGQILDWMLDAPPYNELKIIEEAIP